MSSLSHLYSDFGSVMRNANPDRRQEETEDQVTDAKLASYEDGYKAGWEDAVKATDDEEKRLNDALVQRFEDLSFTYHEAHSKLSSAMKPLLTRFVTKLLPDVMHKALQAQLIDQIGKMIEAQSEQAIEVAVAPEQHAAIETLLADRLSNPFAVTAEPALTQGQIYLRVNQTEREINLDEVLSGISEAVDAFLHDLEAETKNG